VRGLPRQRERSARLNGLIDADAAWEEALIPFVVTEASAAAAVRERVLQLRELLDNADRAWAWDDYDYAEIACERVLSVRSPIGAV
jgi:hypothetical protein